jgi:tetratricopeptide (TPR) repeat protein
MADSIFDAKTPEEFAKLIRRAADGEISMQQFLNFTKDDVDKIALIANALYDNDRLDEALVLLEGLIAIDDKDSRYFNAAGAIFIRQGRLDEAMEALNRALLLNPDNIDAYVNRGEIYLVTAQLEPAASDFEKAIKMDPREENPSANRARQLVWGMYEFLKECEKQGFLDPNFEIPPEALVPTDDGHGH